MNNNSIQTKRGSVKKPGLKILNARTAGKRKQRAVAASSADLGSDVANVGIGRALIVILVLHVVAIGAVIMHTSWTDGQGGEEFSSGTPARPVGGANVENNLAEKKIVPAVVASKPAIKNSLSKEEDDENRVALVGAENSAVSANDQHSIIPHSAILEAEKLQRFNGDARVEQDVEEEIVRAVVVKPSVGSQKVMEYIVSKGDTIWGICKKHKMSVVGFKQLNSLERDVIRIGQKVLIKK